MQKDHDHQGNFFSSGYLYSRPRSPQRDKYLETCIVLEQRKGSTCFKSIFEETFHELFLYINQVINSCWIQTPLCVSTQHCIKSIHSTDCLTLFHHSISVWGWRETGCLQNSLGGLPGGPSFSRTPCRRLMPRVSSPVHLGGVLPLCLPEPLPRYIVSLSFLSFFSEAPGMPLAFSLGATSTIYSPPWCFSLPKLLLRIGCFIMHTTFLIACKLMHEHFFFF